MYGPIESKIYRAATADFREIRSFSPEEQRAYSVGFSMRIHLGGSIRLEEFLPAFEIIRNAPENDRFGTVIRQQLEAAGHITAGNGFSRLAQAQTLMMAYLVDQPFIDRAIDFRRAVQE